MPTADEEVLDTRKGYILTEATAIHVRATHSFVDVYGIPRRAGDEWLLEKKTKDTHIQNVYEEIVQVIEITALASSQYCIVENPVDEKGKPRYGQKELRRGEMKFFLQPGEALTLEGISQMLVL